MLIHDCFHLRFDGLSLLQSPVFVQLLITVHRISDCLIQTKTTATRSAHSSAANVLFKVERCCLSVRKICNFILFKHEVMRNKIRLFTIVS